MNVEASVASTDPFASSGTGANRRSMAGMGVGAGSLKILTGVFVHRVARPLRGSVSCGSGWSVPCVSIQLTLSLARALRLEFRSVNENKQPRAVPALWC